MKTPEQSTCLKEEEEKSFLHLKEEEEDFSLGFGMSMCDRNKGKPPYCNRR